MNGWLIILSVITLVGLMLSVRSCRGVPVSISSVYYALGGNGWMFQVAALLMSFLLFPVWVSVSDPSLQYLPFIACASLAFVAVAPAFRLKLEGAVHYGAAVMCCVCTFIWQLLKGLWDIALWFVLFGAILTLKDWSKWCWWLECAMIGSLIGNIWRVV